MLKDLFTSKKKIFWTIFHVILGLLATQSNWVFIIWYHFVLISTLPVLLKFQNKEGGILYLLPIFYLSAMEMLGRLSQAWPYVPYESGKYLLLLFSLLLLLRGKPRQPLGWLMFLLLIPGTFIDQSDNTRLNDFIFNGLVPLCFAICISYLHGFSLSRSQLDSSLRVVWLASLSALVFTFIRTPDFEEISFSLKAQYQTTANHSSNQVSTVFGLGAFLSLYSIFYRKLFSGNYILDVFILLFFLFQGLLTFSRGGIIVAGFASFVMIVYYNFAYIKKNFSRVAGIALISLLGVMVTFSVVNRISGGMLLLRYQGETEGTLAGSKEKTFDVVVTNRASILSGDIDLFLEYPLLGVGVGASRYLRKAGLDEPAHVEFSRLLADHGILGLVYFVLIIILFYSNLGKHKNSADRGLIIAFFLVAILTSFHAAMRTYVSPLFYLLSYMSIKKI